MRNCFILGTGRSGTSMVAGTLYGAGYFMGDKLHAPNESNPKGYFESNALGVLNEDILASMLVSSYGDRLLRRLGLRERMRYPRFNRQLRHLTRWLAMVPVDREPAITPELSERMRAYLQREPYAFKSPIFCYTLSAWRPFLNDTVFICVFREPEVTVASIQKEVGDRDYLRGISISTDEGFEHWNLMYRHVIEKHRHRGEWLFLHYNQLLTPEGLDRLEAFVDANIDRSFPEARLKRIRSSEPVPAQTAQVYRDLCELAGYDEPS